MAMHVEIELYCDLPVDGECETLYRPSHFGCGDKVSDAIGQARREGWKINPHGTICPTCRRKIDGGAKSTRRSTDYAAVE